MRKTNKIVNIAVIFMIIGVFLGQELAYSSDISCLRVPMGIDKNRAAEILAEEDGSEGLSQQGSQILNAEGKEQKEIIAQCLLFKNCMQQGNLVAASEAANRAYQIFQDPNNPGVRDQAKYIIANYNVLSSAYVKAGKLTKSQKAANQAYQKAQQAADRAYQIFQAYPDAPGVRDEAKYIIIDYNALSSAYVKTVELLHEAQQAANLAYQIFQDPNNPGVRDQAKYIVIDYNALSSAYVKARKLPEAQQAANQAYQIFQAYPDAPGVRDQAEYIIANYFKLISRLSSEIEKSEIVQVFLQEKVPIDKNFIVLTVVAFLYLRTSQTEKAVNLAKKAEEIEGYPLDARMIPWAIIKAADIILREAGSEAVFSDMQGAKPWLIRTLQDAIVHVAVKGSAKKFADHGRKEPNHFLSRNNIDSAL